MQANDFVLNECYFRPMRRLGIDTDKLHVYSPQKDKLIGYYSPSTNELELINNWNLYFSVVLIDELGLRKAA